MAITDAQYRFIYVDVGINGRVGDAGLWLQSDLKFAIEKNQVGIPSPAKLPMSERVCPYTFISDDAFALTNYMMKPYSHTGLTLNEQFFNYMLSRSRRVVENSFGILANRFQVLFAPIYRTPLEASKIVLACVALHNFLRTDCLENKTNADMLPAHQLTNIVGEYFMDVPTELSGPSSRRSAELIRKEFENYFAENR